MKIIRWFLSHFFLILLIVVVIYGYMFWGNLAGENTPAGKAVAYLSSEYVEVDDFVKAVKAKQAQLEELLPAELQKSLDEAVDDQPVENKSVESGSEEPLIAVAPEVSKAPAVAREITPQPVSISYSHNQMRVKQSSTGDIESAAEVLPQTEDSAVSVELETQPEVVADAEPEPEQQVEVVADAEPAQQLEVTENAESAPILEVEELTSNNAISPVEESSPVVAAMVEVATPDNFVSPKVEQQLNNVDKEGKVINSALKSYAIRESWVTARKSFYQRKYKLSEQSYRDVINNTSDNFDAYGELGNVYFNQGKKAEAASAYFEAASILLRKGQIGRARSLIGPLRHLDKNKAVDLQKLIDSAAS